jgi:hypothetical protein
MPVSHLSPLVQDDHTETYLDRAEYPENEGLYYDQSGRPDSKRKVDADVLSDLRVAAVFLIHL